MAPSTTKTSNTKTEAEWISFLLLCLDCNEGKVNYNKVAVRSGLYKAGKYSKQALDGLKKKYPLPDADANEQGAPTAKAVKPEKRKAEEDANGDGDENVKPGRKKQVKVEQDVDAEGDEEEEPKPAKKKPAQAKPKAAKSAIKPEDSDSTEEGTS